MTRLAALARTVATLGLLAAAVACRESAPPRNFVLSPLPTSARTITVTLDQCDCAHCRVAVIDPVTGVGILSRIDPLVGVELSADTCYNDSRVTVIVECGNCPGPGACTAAATLKASGVTLSPSASCTTGAFAGQDCQDLQTIDPIPANAPIVGC